MTSPSPLLYDTYYHIYNRGVNGEDIFVQERNYDLFLRLFEKHLMPVCDLFAYCLLKNHFHISVRVKAEEEILATKKGLRVSSVDLYHAKPGEAAGLQAGQRRKHLGSQHVSDRFSNFFNAYAKRFALTRPTGGQGVYSSTPLGAYRSRQTTSFGM